MADSDIILRAEGVTKLYPGTTALDRVDFNVYRGRVNVLVGENGAGKSTLMKIIAGAEQPTSGTLVLEGRPVSFRSVNDAARQGIGIIFQELNLCPNLSVAENIFLAKELTRAKVTVDHGEQLRRAAALMRRLEQDIDPRALVSELRIGQQQIVEIAKALAQDVRILIMDEPTSALSAAEVAVLFRVIEDLTRAGVAIIYISHRLDELTRIGDVITVLRDGELQAEAAIDDIDVPWIIERMVGAKARRVDHVSHIAEAQPLLAVRDVCLPRPGGGLAVDHVSLDLRPGEIVGIYGLMGAGRSELFDCLIGRAEGATGRIELVGEAIDRRSIGGRVRRGLSLVPEDRQREGLAPILSVTDNMTLASLWKHSGVFGLDGRRVKAAVGRMVRTLRIKLSSPDVAVSALSGGNQQKVVIGKGLLTEPKVLLMDEPTRGIDVGAKSEVFQIMEDLAAQGMGILFVSSDLKEIMTVGDRMIVMSNGRVTGRFTRAEATEEALVAASAAGHQPVHADA
jgi:erythritol transport system ATP-binding protein